MGNKVSIRIHTYIYIYIYIYKTCVYVCIVADTGVGQQHAR